MSDIDSERFNQIKSILLSEHTIKVKNNWITECVNFFSSENPGISVNELKSTVFEQFLLSEAKDSFNPVIPATIQQKEEPFTLNGTFVLQLQFLIDICKFISFANRSSCHNFVVFSYQLNHLTSNGEDCTILSSTMSKRIVKVKCFKVKRKECLNSS